jgi:hypothetical protein
MTLEEVETIAKDVLAHTEPLIPSAETECVAPIHEQCVAESGDPLTEAKVRSTFMNVIHRLAALLSGTWTSSPEPMNIGGVEQRAVHKGTIALGFRLQFDSGSLKTILHVGGHIVGNKHNATPGV